MSLSDLAAIGSLISGVAVLISLIYLARQMRQNTKHTRALIQQGRVERISNQQLKFAESDLAASWLVANGIKATPEAVQQRQFEQQCIVYFVGWDDTFSQYQEGLVSEEQFARFREQMVRMLRANPGTCTFFKTAPVARGDGKLQAFVAALIDEAEAVSQSHT
jgi:hypothetical protein